MKNNTKKWLTVAGCLAVCVVLVIVIASSFSKDKVTDDPLPPSSSQQSEVVVDPDSSIVLPEEDQTKYFMVSLILQNLYREILTVADENGGRLKNRVVFFADELGTCPPIQSLELMFSASRSRGLMLVPIVQSITGQLQKNYGKEGSEIIVDNCQVNLYGGFAPASQTAVELSKSLGSRTVMSGSMIPRRESGSSIGAKKRVGVKSKYSMMLNSSRREGIEIPLVMLLM